MKFMLEIIIILINLENIFGNNDLGINNYKGLSIGKLFGITFGELGSLLIIGIIVFIYTKKKLDSQKYKCNDSEKPENKNKSNNTELRINLPK